MERIVSIATSKRGWPVVLLLLAIAGHAYSLTVTGARFWIDSIVYFQLALDLFDGDALVRLYDSGFGFFYQHTGMGLPLLIRLLDAIFRDHLWPALAVLQHGLSALAVTYFVLAFNGRLSRLAQIAAVIVCSLHPYFAAFNGAPLTESVSASLLLFSLGITIRALDGRVSVPISFGMLLPLSIVAAQFRPYLGLVVILATVVILQKAGGPWRLRIPMYAVTVLALVAGLLAFPIYRTVLGVSFFLPNVSGLLLTHVSYVSWDLDQETSNSLKTVVQDEAIREQLIGREKFNYDSARRVMDDLVASGVSRREAQRRIAAAAWRVRISSVWSIERQLQLPLASIGLQLAPVCCLPGRQLMRDFDAKGLYRVHRAYWRWNSGLANESYLETFDRFTEMTRSLKIFTEAADEFYIARIRPYITDVSKPFRDPLRLLFSVSDPLIVLGWVGMFLCFWPQQRLTLLVLAAPFVVIYAASAYAAVVGDNRHAHPLLPIIVVGCMKAADEFFARRLWTRFWSWKRPASG